MSTNEGSVGTIATIHLDRKHSNDILCFWLTVYVMGRSRVRIRIIIFPISDYVSRVVQSSKRSYKQPHHVLSPKCLNVATFEEAAIEAEAVTVEVAAEDEAAQLAVPNRRSDQRRKTSST
jgi:hypothetical protein